MVPALRMGDPRLSFFPADLVLRMAAADDLGAAAGDRVTSDLDDADIRYLKGPDRYTERDVAAVFGRSLPESRDRDRPARGVGGTVLEPWVLNGGSMLLCPDDRGDGGGRVPAHE